MEKRSIQKEQGIGNWAVDNSNQNNNRGQEQKQSQNRMYSNRAINALALDNRNSRQNMKCNYCSRTNHTENQCYYKPINMQNNYRNRQDGQFRNQGNQNNWTPRRNENVRYIQDQEIEGDFEQPINEGITFNRESDFALENGNNQKETIMKEREENNRGEYNVYATFVEGFGNCEDSTCYGMINGIPSKIIRDTGASCSFINSKLVKKENYTGEKVTVVLAEGRSQVKPIAIIPVKTPFYTGRLKCIVSEGAKHDLLLGNYNGNQKIGGCQFNRMFNDRNVKEVYDKRVKAENVRKNVAMESSRQKEYINYISMETRKDKCNENKRQGRVDIIRNKTVNKRKDESVNTNKINTIMRKDKFNMKANTSRIISRSKNAVQPKINKGRKIENEREHEHSKCKTNKIANQEQSRIEVRRNYIYERKRNAHTFTKEKSDKIKRDNHTQKYTNEEIERIKTRIQMKPIKKIEGNPEELLVEIDRKYEVTKKNVRSKIFNQVWNRKGYRS